MADLIDRQSAIDAIKKLCEECDASWCGECRVNYPNKDVLHVLEALPSVSPEFDLIKGLKIAARIVAGSDWEKME